MIIVQFDAKYHHWAHLLIRSLQLHEPTERILVDGVNLADGQVAELHSAHDKIHVLNDTTTWAEVTPKIMVSRKPFVFLNAMDRFPNESRYALLDADFLVRRELSQLWAKVDHQPTALFRTNGMWQGRYYQHLETPSGIVLIRPDGRQLIEAWGEFAKLTEPIGKVQPQGWHWDQATLIKALRQTKIGFCTIPMHIYADERLTEMAVIWSAHIGDGKERYFELFLREHERLVRAAEA